MNKTEFFQGVLGIVLTMTVMGDVLPAQDLVPTQNEKGSPKTAEDFYRRAEQHENAGRKRKAIADYKKAGELDPKLFDAHFTRSSLLAELRDYAGAVEALTASLQARPHSYSALFNRGLYRQYLQKYDEAIEDYSEAISDDADFRFVGESPEECRAHAYHYRGRVYQWYKEEHKKAIADYSAALRLDPSLDQIFYRRAVCYHAIREYAKAQADFDRGFEKDPNDRKLCSAWAWQLATCPDEEFRDGARAVLLAKSAKDLDVLSAAFAEVGEFDKAVETLRQAMEQLANQKVTRGPAAKEQLIEQKAKMKARMAAYMAKRPYREY